MSGTGIAPDLKTGHNECALERVAEHVGLKLESYNLGHLGVGHHCGLFKNRDWKKQKNTSKPVFRMWQQ